MNNEELMAKLQEVIDYDFELAKQQVVEQKEKYNINSDLKAKFCFFVCWDLKRIFDLDMKGVIGE
jgi:hypothetical protein